MQQSQQLIGKIIREKRLQQKMSQQQLGSLINYSDSSISGFENGDRQLSFFTACKIAEALECSLDELNPNPFDY